MKTNINKSRILCMIGFGIALAFMPGCATYDNNRSDVQENENLLLLREDVNRCKSRMETMEIEQQRLMQEMAQLRSARGQDDPNRARLDEMERRIAALNAARETDHQAIIDKLSGNMAKMMGTASSKPGKSASGPSASAASGTGYEHVVKDGETLSAIAAAYKVKPAAIIEANDLKNPNALRKGQKLFIPQ